VSVQGGVSVRTMATTPPTRRSSTRRSIGALAVFMLIAATVAATGALVATDAFSGWYAHAAKPMWTPPDAVIVPALAVSAALMAVSAWLVWRQPDTEERSSALTVYVLQLALWAVWAPAFFGLGAVVGVAGPWVALIIIVLVAVVLLATLFRFWDVSRPAAVLLIPSFIWVLYAMTLNAAIAVLAM
jgi:translocator protein